MSIPYPNHGANYFDVKDDDFENFKNEIDPSKINLLENIDFVETHATYYNVRALHKNIEIELNKNDVPRQHPLEDDPLFIHAMYLAEKMVSHVLSQEPSYGPYEINSGAAPGIPYTKLGYRNKGQALTSQEFREMAASLTHYPLNKIFDKKEFLPIGDLEGGKVRTITCSPIDFIMKQKFLFDNQNSAIKEESSKPDFWIRYGFCKQYGGFNDLMSMLEKFDSIFQSDGSRWDKNIFLGPCCKLRRKFLKLKSQVQLDVLDYTEFHTLKPIVVHPDGVVYQRDTGNISGQNDTAPDNSLAHLVIVMHLLTYLYHEKTGELLDYFGMIENARFHIYSDDKTGGANSFYFGFTKESFMQAEAYIYSLYGIVIKPSSFFFQEKECGDRLCEDIEFLGSRCIYHPEINMYLPYPRLGKVFSSIVYDDGKGLHPTFKFQKIIALMFLCIDVPQFLSVGFEYLEWYYNKNLRHSASFDVTMKNAHISFGMNPQRLVFSLQNLWTGFESFH